MEKMRPEKKRKLKDFEKFSMVLETKLTRLWIRQIQNQLRMEKQAKKLSARRKVSDYVI
jgi:hypothetical protein